MLTACFITKLGSPCGKLRSEIRPSWHFLVDEDGINRVAERAKILSCLAEGQFRLLAARTLGAS
jgi:hypothetical protein